MIWIAPSEKYTDNCALEKRFRDAADHFRVNSGPKSRKYSTFVLGLILPCLAAVLILGTAHAADSLARRQWIVDGVAREALVYMPPRARTNPAPVVFAFHGHGGSMQNAARSFSYHTHWPEAIVVYMQGLDTPGRLTDPEGTKSGWQSALGPQQV